MLWSTDRRTHPESLLCPSSSNDFHTSLRHNYAHYTAPCCIKREQNGGTSDIHISRNMLFATEWSANSSFSLSKCSCSYIGYHNSRLSRRNVFKIANISIYLVFIHSRNIILAIQRFLFFKLMLQNITN